MLYRDDPIKAVENSQDLLIDNREKIEAMTVPEWLLRLDLAELAPQFTKFKIYSITDLRHFMEEQEMDKAGF